MFHAMLLGALFAVGFTHVSVPDGPTSIDTAIWYPTTAPVHDDAVGPFLQPVALDAIPSGTAFPLIVISHGTGGDFSNHADTAYALAQAGFVVAAPTHEGDNWRDQSRALDILDRARQVHVVLGYVLAQWHPGLIDARRVGAFGFSSGGFTVLVAAGGDPDLATIDAHCRAHPFFFDCRLRATHSAGSPEAAVHDTRIRALVVAAPALGFTFSKTGLASVTIPVQLWRADDDHVLPAPYYADAVRAALPAAPFFYDVPGAGHYDFIAPCSQVLAQLAPVICTSEAGFDRAAFHRTFNARIVAFFNQILR